MRNNLGILGGGQLGMFICQAAKKHNVRTTVFSDSEKFSAKEFCDNYFIGSFSNKEMLDEFINSADFLPLKLKIFL